MSASDTNRSAVWLDEANVFPELISHLLAEGQPVRFSAPGDSMYPTICDGDVITVAPVKTARVETGDIIVYRHKSGVAAHRVLRVIEQSKGPSCSASDDLDDRSSCETLRLILRGDAAVVLDDPVAAAQVLGRVTLVERQGRRIYPYSFKAIVCFKARRLASRLKRFIFFQLSFYPLDFS